MDGEKKSGSIEASSIGIAINSLQSRNLIIISINPADEKKDIIKYLSSSISKIKTREIVILSRQMSTLFEAKVPVIESFKLIAGETENVKLKNILIAVTDDIKGGLPISQSLAKHPEVFSQFYVNMIKAGEEAGKLEQIFGYLADYMERYYELTAKTKKALIYPAFIVFTFIAVMGVMMAFVIPKLTSVLLEVGQDIPVYTKIIIGASNFTRNFGIFIVLAIIGAGFFLWRYSKTKEGGMVMSRIQLSVPYLGDLYRKFFLSRITDSLETSISSGIPVVRALEIAADVVGTGVYKTILISSVDEVRSGNSLSQCFGKYEHISPLVTQMIKIGEESGKLDFMLRTLSRFYKKEVDNSVDTVISLIEPAMIIVLALGVGILLLGILGPIYNIAGGM